MIRYRTGVPGVAHGANNAEQHVIEHHYRDAQKDHKQVGKRIIDNIRRSAHPFQKGAAQAGNDRPHHQ